MFSILMDPMKENFIDELKFNLYNDQPELIFHDAQNFFNENFKDQAIKNPKYTLEPKKSKTKLYDSKGSYINSAVYLNADIVLSPDIQYGSHAKDKLFILMPDLLGLTIISSNLILSGS
jgi:hypothetical protein